MRHGRIGFWYRLVVCVVMPLLRLFTRRDWRGSERIPLQGGVIVAANHISKIDPMTLGYFVYATGRTPRYLAKAELFRVPVLTWILRGAHQIPVHRNTPDATLALRDAIDAVNRGECLLIYPEGTITRDPDGWPMLARTGVARLALATGAPVIPVGQWGAQELLPAYTKRFRVFPRKTIGMSAGPAVDLARFAGSEPAGEVLRAATDTVMAAIREQVGVLRDETVPLQVFDPAGVGATLPKKGETAGDRRSA